GQENLNCPYVVTSENAGRCRELSHPTSQRFRLAKTGLYFFKHVRRPPVFVASVRQAVKVLSVQLPDKVPLTAIREGNPRVSTKSEIDEPVPDEEVRRNFCDRRVVGQKGGNAMVRVLKQVYGGNTTKCDASDRGG